MKVELYQFLGTGVLAEKPSIATIEDKMIHWESNKFVSTQWFNFKEADYEINEKYKKIFPGKEFNTRMMAEVDSGGFRLEFYTCLNKKEVNSLNKMFGNHWTQNPEQWASVIGAFLGSLFSKFLP